MVTWKKLLPSLFLLAIVGAAGGLGGGVLVLRMHHPRVEVVEVERAPAGAAAPASGAKGAPKLAAVNPTTPVLGLELRPVAGDPCPPGTCCAYRDGSSRVLLHNADNTLTELSPGWAQRLPPTALSMLGPEVRVEAGIGGGTCVFRIDPSNGKTPPFSCKFGDVVNGGSDDSDAQFGCAWNNSGCGGYDPTKGGWGFNAENYCGNATGCVDNVHAKQLEFYIYSDPPAPTGSTWLPLHAYGAEAQVVGLDGQNYIATVGGTSGNVCVGPSCFGGSPCSGGPCNNSDPEVPLLRDGTVTWAHYGGRRVITLNQTISDFGFADLGLVADHVGFGNSNGINGANVLNVQNGGISINTVDDGVGGANALVVPANLQGLINPIKAVVPGVAAGILEICPPSGCTDGCQGICLRGSLSTIAGDTLFIGSDPDGHRFVDAFLHAVSPHQATEPLVDIPRGHLTIVETPDNVTKGDQLAVVLQGTVTGNGGYGSVRVRVPHVDGFGEAACHQNGIGSTNCGGQFCSRNAGSPSGNGAGFHATALVYNYTDNKAFATEVAATQDANDLVEPSPATTVYRTKPIAAGSNAYIDLVAGSSTGCVQPRLVVGEAKLYMVKWEAELQAIGF